VRDRNKVLLCQQVAPMNPHTMQLQRPFARAGAICGHSATAAPAAVVLRQRARLTAGMAAAVVETAAPVHQQPLEATFTMHPMPNVTERDQQPGPLGVCEGDFHHLFALGEMLGQVWHCN